MDKSSLEFGHIRKIYERNNRSTQMKALRCFPTCKSSGHSTVGFCGSSLKAVLFVYIDQESPQCQRHDSFWNQVLYIAEIRCSDEEGLSNRRYILKSEILPQIRSKSEKYKPYIPGLCREIKTKISSENSSIMTKEITLEFNSEQNAWHYGWTSHRFSSDKTHVIDVMTLVQLRHDDDCYFLAGSFLSSCFTVVSTKRSRIEKQGDMDDEETEEGDGATCTSTDSPQATVPSGSLHSASVTEALVWSDFSGDATQSYSSESCSGADSDYCRDPDLCSDTSSSISTCNHKVITAEGGKRLVGSPGDSFSEQRPECGMTGTDSNDTPKQVKKSRVEVTGPHDIVNVK